MPERIQLRRTKGWRKPKAAVVVARPGAWGNPFVVHEHGDRCGVDLYATAYTDHKPFPPIIVRKFGRTKKLVALDGNHRRTAAANAGHTTHPALIVDCTDEAALTIMIEGNMANGLQLPKQQRIAQAVHLVELGGIIRHSLWSNNIRYVDVPPSNVKKYATGRGNAPKPDIRMEVYKRFGVDYADDNACDAFVLAAMGLDALGHPLIAMPATHRVALNKIVWPTIGERAA